MKIPLFYIDAFSNEVFKGNTAAVCILESWLPDEFLQSIASEHLVSETAFIVKDQKEMFHLRWFTPKMEVPLCGHATLAAAHVIFSIYDFGAKPIKFKTKSGILPVKKTNDGKIMLDFPAYPSELTKVDPLWSKALGVTIKEAYKSIYTLLILDNEDDICDIKPNFQLLKELEKNGVIVTAPGSDCDFVSRFFAPLAGINEDPVTGSAHCVLAPYWAKKLNKNTFFARQLSERTGDIWCQLENDRVMISGYATTYMQGMINIKGKPSSVLVPFDFAEEQK